MPFLGKTPTVGNFILLDSITVSNTATFALTKDSLDYYPGSAQNMIVSVNGVTQAPLTAYTITDSNIIFASALDSDVDVIDYILVLGDTLNIGRPSDSTVGATQLQDYAVTSVKMSNTGVGAATYGTSTSIPQITIDAAGRITSATGIDRSNQFEDLTVTGNLTVSGNTITVDAHTLDVEDPLIHLASNNTTTDVVDIGFIGHYSNDGSTQLHTGFFRDASDEKYYLFNGLEGDYDTATTIDRTANNFTLADLNAGGLSLEATNAELSFTDDGRLSKLYTRNGGRDLEILANQDVIINASGGTNLGIGTTSPSYLVDARTSSGNAQIYLRSGGDLAQLLLISDDTTGTSQINFGDADANNIGLITYTHNLNAFRFTVNSAEAMRIASSGNVAIGNTNATYILDVDVGAPSSTDQVLGRFSSQNGIRDIGFVWDDSNSTLGVATLTNHSLSFHTNGNSSERMRITSTGTVRIDPNGTTAGLSSLGITTNAMTIGDLGTFNLAFDSNELQSRNNGASNNLILNKNGGTVAIGAAENTGGLYITSAQNRTIILDATFPTGSFTWQSVRRSGSEKFRWFINNDDSMSIYSDAGSTFGMTWNTAGDAGLTGSDTPVNAAAYRTLELGQSSASKRGRIQFNTDQGNVTLYSFEQGTQPYLGIYTDHNSGTYIGRFDSDGLKFGNDSAAANALDDYEEGTFTPGFAYSGGNGNASFTFANATGKYTKIGNVCYYSIDLRFNSFIKGTASGTPQVTNLPFTPVNYGNYNRPQASLSLYQWPYTTTDGHIPTASPQQQGSINRIDLFRQQPNAASAAIDDPDANSMIFISGFYYTV